MAKYLITQDDNILEVVEAKSIREAVEDLNVKGNGEFQVYTVTGQRTVVFETVEETRLTFGVSEGQSEEE